MGGHPAGSGRASALDRCRLPSAAPPRPNGGTASVASSPAARSPSLQLPCTPRRSDSPRRAATGAWRPRLRGVSRTGDHRRVSGGGSGWIGTATPPWGPVLVAASPHGLLGLGVLWPREPFVTVLVGRTGRAPAPGSTPLLDQAIAAVGAFLAGDPEPLAHVPVE